MYVRLAAREEAAAAAQFGAEHAAWASARPRLDPKAEQLVSRTGDLAVTLAATETNAG